MHEQSNRTSQIGLLTDALPPSGANFVVMARRPDTGQVTRLGTTHVGGNGSGRILSMW